MEKLKWVPFPIDFFHAFLSQVGVDKLLITGWISVCFKQNDFFSSNFDKGRKFVRSIIILSGIEIVLTLRDICLICV